MSLFGTSPRLPGTRASLHLLGACLLVSSALAAEGKSSELFEKRIRPLLIEKCYGCHSPDKKIKGGLRLDHREGWATGGDSGPAIVPGKPEESLLIKAVSYLDRDLKMPPKQKLPDADIAALQEWIAQGAPDPRVSDEPKVAKAPAPAKADPATWWSLQPIKKTQPPAVKDSSWPRNAIDHFILAKLEASHLRPSPDAPTPVLTRRLHYDLTGLPNLPEAPAAPTPNSEPRTPNSTTDPLVDQLLSSPRFGERFASHWLDITRFAESSGGGRTLPFKDAWRYRDYVIESFNANAPMNRFLMEQVAGDLLPAPTSADRRRNLTATAFLVLGPTNYEEQDKTQLRMDIVDEQLDTFGKAFLGLTIGCARCHDHKFDPIPTRDYYALAGILRSTRVLRNFKDNVAHWIDTPLPMDEPQESQLVQKETKLAALRTELDESTVALKKAGVDASLKNLKAGKLPVSALPGIVVDDIDAKLIGDWKRSTAFKTYIGEGYLSDHNRDKGGLTATFQPKMIEAGRYEVRLAYIAAPDRDTQVPVTVFHADGEVTIKVDQSAPAPIDGRWVSLGTFRFEANGEGYVLVSNTDTTHYVTADAVQFLKVDAAATTPQVAAADPAPEKSKKKKKTKDAPPGDASPLAARIAALEKEIKTFDSDGPKRPEAMSVHDDDPIADCPIHLRGQVRNLGAAVPRGFLSAVRFPFDEKISADQSGRLQLAHWLVSEKNPLTARVLANRVWLWLMGEGLVRTPDNFGLMGEKPSHPELLDYLASELIDSGWDLKHLVKLIVSSRTYQMSSNASPDAPNPKSEISNPQLSDPDNRLFWRQNRQRLDAEEMRDTLLVLGGNLDPGLGGPNIVKVKAIDANDDNAGNLEYGYKFTDSRRSLYTPAFRNVRHPIFEVFDFADINQPNGRRTTSTIAPQALFLLNHPFVITECRLAATLLLAQGDASDETRVTRLFQDAYGRAPTAGELKHALHFLDSSVSGNAEADELRDVWARLLQALVVSPDFRFLE